MKYNITTIIACLALAIFAACNGNNSHSGHNHSHESEEAHDHEGHDHEHEGHDHNHEGHNHEHEGHDHEQEGHEGHNHAAEGAENGTDEITFSPIKAKQFGVVATKVQSGNFHESIKVSGQVIGAQGDEYTVAAPSAGMVKFRSSTALGSNVGAGATLASISAKNMVGGDSNEQAQIVLNNAKRELERLKPLYAEKIVTAREYNAAVEAYERARAACTSKSGAGNSATTAIGGTITEIYVSDGQYVEAGAPIAKVSKNARLVLRADLPSSYSRLVSNIHTANFRTSNSDEMLSIEALKGRRISSNSATTTQPGYIPVCFEFNNDGSVVSGSFAEVYLIGNERPNALTVPLKALTEELGSFFVYVKLDDECYMKRAVKVGINDGVNVEILSGLKAGEMVVSQGAMIIKLAGSGAAIPGHTHEH